MTDMFTIEQIHNIRARQLPGGDWEITFESANEGLFHQLYVDGRLADCTDGVEQRSFVLSRLALPCRLTIAAVDANHRQLDMSASYPQAFALPPWVFRAWVVRGPWHSRDDRVALLDDHAGQSPQPSVVAVRDVWPIGVSRRGWGEDSFGLVGFGYDTSSAPGLGVGAFGAGPFGLDSEVIALEAALLEEGRHRLVVRTLKPDGRFTDGAELEFLSCPPPPPPASVAPVSYDAQTATLTLELKRG